MKRSIVVFALASCTVLMLQEISSATSPGRNGSIAFVRKRAGKQIHIFTMHRDGTHARPVGPAGALEPTWSPDGSKIAYWAPGYHLAIMWANGAPVADFGPYFQDRISEISWSPDGTKIAFGAWTSNAYNVHLIYIIDARSGRTLFRSQPPGFGRDSDPNWSPGGGRIAFVRYFPYRWELYTMDPRGGHLRRLTNSPGRKYAPDWAPDGSKLVFIRTRRNHGVFNTDIATVSRRHRIDVLVKTETNVPGPVFSPDGRLILFSRYLDAQRRSKLFVMRANGTHERQLTYIDDTNPSWQALP